MKNSIKIGPLAVGIIGTCNEKLILCLARTFARLPEPAKHTVADVLGRVAFYLYRKDRNLAVKNVQTFFPNASASIQQNIVIRSFQHMVESAFDLMRFATEATHWPTITIKHMERMDAALGKGRGVILITGHYGNLEMMAFGLKNISPSPGFLSYKPTRKLGWVVDRFRLYRHAYRQAIMTPKTGFQLLESSVPGVMKAAHLLKRGNVVIMAADLIFGSAIIPVTFLNMPFRMSRVPASISLRTHALLLPVITVRHSDGRYDIVVEEPIEPPTTGSYSEAEQSMTETFARILGRHVESAPEQWCWTQLVGLTR